MKIGDRLVVCEPRHPLYKNEGSLVGFRGDYAPGDKLLLIVFDNAKRSYIVPQSMVKPIGLEGPDQKFSIF